MRNSGWSSHWNQRGLSSYYHEGDAEAVNEIEETSPSKILAKVMNKNHCALDTVIEN